MDPSTHSGTTLDTLQYEGAEITIIDCRDCGYAHALPLPTQAELTAIYEREYFAGPKADFKADDDRDSEWIRMLMDERIDFLDTHFDPSREAVDVLDVGCGFGTFLAAAEARGYKAFGCDPATQAVESCKAAGYTIRQGFFDADTECLYGGVDAIHMREILNHAPNPAELANRAKRMLAPDGVFLGSVANDYNPLQLAARDQLGTPPYWLAYPHHLNYFNPESLKGLLRAAGFKHITISGSYPIELHLLGGDDYVSDKALGRAIHQRRVAADLALAKADLRSDLYRAWINLGVGREIVFYAWG